jgi:hypothetical protein
VKGFKRLSSLFSSGHVLLGIIYGAPDFQTCSIAFAIRSARGAGEASMYMGCEYDAMHMLRWSMRPHFAAATPDLASYRVHIGSTLQNLISSRSFPAAPAPVTPLAPPQQRAAVPASKALAPPAVSAAAPAVASVAAAAASAAVTAAASTGEGVSIVVTPSAPPRGQKKPATASGAGE